MEEGKRDYIAIAWRQALIGGCYKGTPSPAEINAPVILDWIERQGLLLIFALKVSLYPDTVQDVLSEYRPHFWREACGRFKVLNETLYERLKEWLSFQNKAGKEIKELERMYALQCNEIEREPIDTVSEILAREVPDMVDYTTKKIIPGGYIEYTIRGLSLIPIEDVRACGKNVMRRIGGLSLVDQKDRESYTNPKHPVWTLRRAIELAEIEYSVFGRSVSGMSEPPARSEIEPAEPVAGDTHEKLEKKGQPTKMDRKIFRFMVEHIGETKNRRKNIESRHFGKGKAESTAGHSNYGLVAKSSPVIDQMGEYWVGRDKAGRYWIKKTPRTSPYWILLPHVQSKLLENF